MTDSDKPQFAEILRGVMAFYRQDITTFSMSVWWATCERFELEQVSKAFSLHVTDAERGVFAPKPADIIRKLSGTVSDRAMLAWGIAFDAMSRVGAYSDVVFDDPAIHAAINDLGGWPKVCRTETKNLSYLQHQFIESHRAYAERGKFDYPSLLYGDRSPDDVYEKKGIKPPPPVVIGDTAKARLVYKGGNKGLKTENPLVSLESAALKILRN